MRPLAAAFCLIWISEMTAIWTDSENCEQQVDIELNSGDWSDAHVSSKELTDDPIITYPRVCYSEECRSEDGH